MRQLWGGLREKHCACVRVCVFALMHKHACVAGYDDLYLTYSGFSLNVIRYISK